MFSSNIHIQSGGTFLNRILENEQFSEKIASRYMFTILSAVSDMHSKNIVHRDLKLNNMVFDGPEEDANLKIIDFGDSDIMEDEAAKNEWVGTLYYLSPGNVHSDCHLIFNCLW